MNNTFKTILIILLITIILILLLNHFFLKSNIIWDDLINAYTDDGGIPYNKMNIDNTIYTGQKIKYPNTNFSVSSTENSIYNLAKNSGSSGLAVPNKAFPTVIGPNFTFSIWFFIDDYNQNINYCKYISSIIGIDGSNFKPTLMTFLTPQTNNLGIAILTQSSNTQSMQTYFIENIPLQKWNCLIISVTDRTMDIYLEGKLINSYILENFYVPPAHTSTLFIGSNLQNQYFNGFITRARYINHGVNPEEAYSIYKEGISTSFAGDFLNKYRLKVGLYEYQNKVGGFTI